MAAEKTYKIRGMHCASCVSLIRGKIGGIPDVRIISVNFSTEKAKIVFEDTPLSLNELNSVISPFGYSFYEVEESAETNAPGMDRARINSRSGEERMVFEMKLVLPMVVFSFAIMLWDALSRNDIVAEMPEGVFWFVHHLMPILASFVLFGIGRRYIRAAWIFLKTGVANMDTLVGISTVIAFIYSFIITAFEKKLSGFLDVDSNFYDVVIVVIGLIAFGQFLEARAKRKTNKALRRLAGLVSKSALVERDGGEVEMPIEKIEIGYVVIVKPNERVPVDGRVVSGASSIDESSITGESIPVDKIAGDSVFAGTQNFQGLIKIAVEKDSRDTALAHIIKIVENAQNSKAPIERIADRVSGVFVYVVIALAAITFVSWLIFAPGALGMSKAFMLALSSTMAVLVIACPCSLGLATPTAIITGVGAGARRGILIKNAESMEKLSKVQVIVFDKTGTLTENKLSIEGIFCEDKNHLCNAQDIGFKQSIIYSMTKASKHPVSESVASWLREAKAKEVPADKIREVPGKGMAAEFMGERYYLGSIGYVSEALGKKPEKIRENFDEERFESGRELYLADSKNVLALIKISDTIKANALREVARIKKLGLRVVMATGDNKKTGEAVAKDLGISEVFAEVKPEDKLKIIKDFQGRGFKVAMIGDGVNDSPALAQAEVAISVSDGSDIAIESSDIVLLNGDIGKVAEAVNLAKKTSRTIWQNLIWSFGYNSIGIPIAAGVLFPFWGWMLNPAIAGAIMAFESITVVMNSLRIKNAKL